MIDMHAHVLFDVDDGAIDFASSREIIDQAEKDGVVCMYATPHFIPGHVGYTNRILTERVHELNSYARSKGYNIEIDLGQEIYIDPALPERIESGEVLTLGKSRYLLVELPMHGIPVYMDHILHELQVMGYTPIIAHPERNSLLMENPNLLYEYLEKGAYAQLNLKSLTGRYGKTVKNAAELMLDCKMYQFVGSDAHVPSTRGRLVSNELDRLRKLVSGGYYDALTEANPYAVRINAQTVVSEHHKFDKRSKLIRMVDKFRRATA